MSTFSVEEPSSSICYTCAADPSPWRKTLPVGRILYLTHHSRQSSTENINIFNLLTCLTCSNHGNSPACSRARELPRAAAVASPPPACTFHAPGGWHGALLRRWPAGRHLPPSPRSWDRLRAQPPGSIASWSTAEGFVNKLKALSLPTTHLKHLCPATEKTDILGTENAWAVRKIKNKLHIIW